MSSRIVATLGVITMMGTLACSGGSSDGTPTQQPPVAQVGTVSGLVADAGGTAIGGAGLSLSATGATPQSTTSGSDGRYTFNPVKAGTWTVSVTPPSGFNVSGQSSLTVTVGAGQTASANFTLAQTQVQPPPAGGNASVAISGFAFSPQAVTVTAGSTVTWTNNDAATHTVTGDKSEFDSGNMGNKSTFSQTFNSKGTFNYHCAIHAGMTGTVTVQ